MIIYIYIYYFPGHIYIYITFLIIYIYTTSLIIYILLPDYTYIYIYIYYIPDYVYYFPDALMPLCQQVKKATICEPTASDKRYWSDKIMTEYNACFILSVTE
jgi:hypothetical protein